ncbi:MAG: uracil-DNA glycosylase family protein [Chryseolinea sp.]
MLWQKDIIKVHLSLIIEEMTHARHILNFLKALHIEPKLPAGVEVLNPYQNKETFALCTLFYNKYYSDYRERVLILGINPGRLGAGLTGIPFTDPIKLDKFCHIANDLPKKPELSADFIYKVIEAYGGLNSFYGKFHFSSVSPLGFTKDNKNLNYYDIKELQNALYQFIVGSMHQILTANISRSKCYCLGEGQNFKYLQAFNQEHHLFDEIVPLPHPRFIMQYKRKTMNRYVDDYLQKLSAVE